MQERRRGYRADHKGDDSGDSSSSEVSSGDINCPVCGLPNNYVDAMVACDRCNNWFHYPCVDIHSDEDLDNVEWHCYNCTID